MTTEGKTESVTVQWAGKRTRATVLRRYKNGRLRVRLDGETQWTMGRMGSRTPAPVVTLDAWQEVKP